MCVGGGRAEGNSVIGQVTKHFFFNLTTAGCLYVVVLLKGHKKNTFVLNSQYTICVDLINQCLPEVPAWMRRHTWFPFPYGCEPEAGWALPTRQALRTF